MKRSGRRRRVKVSADGNGVVSHAGSALLRELATETGLAGAVTGALLDTYRGFPVHMPGQVFADLAVAIADGADAVTGIEVLRDREALFGRVASMPTAWRLLDRIDAVHLDRVRAARAVARRRAWEAGAAPEPGGELRVDFDATISIAHSEKQDAAATWKKTFGFHPLLAFLDRPEVAGGEGLAGLLRPGNAGSNTAADHVTVLDLALAQLPEHARPRPGDPDSPRVLARSDSAGATHVFAAACRKRGVRFSFGFPVDERIQHVVGLVPGQCWHPAIEDDGLRDGAWVAEGHRHDRPVLLAGGLAADLAQGTPAPRCPAHLHRRGRAPHHRVPHRHPARADPRPGSRAGTAAPPARPGRGPHPAGEGIRPAEPALPRPGGEQRLAGSRARRRRPHLLGQADLLRARALAGPLRDRRVPLPGPARGRPAHPLRPPHLPED